MYWPALAIYEVIQKPLMLIPYLTPQFTSCFPDNIIKASVRSLVPTDIGAASPELAASQLIDLQ
jgi:hypothetical protein